MTGPEAPASCSYEIDIVLSSSTQQFPPSSFPFITLDASQWAEQFPSSGAAPDPKIQDEVEEDASSAGSSAYPSRCSSYLYDPADFPRLQEYEEFRAPSFQSWPSTPSISRLPSRSAPDGVRIEVQESGPLWLQELQIKANHLIAAAAGARSSANGDKIRVQKPQQLRLGQLRDKVADLSDLLKQWNQSAWERCIVARDATVCLDKARRAIFNRTTRVGAFIGRRIFGVDVFREVSSQLDQSIGNMTWLLRIFNEGWTKGIDDDAEEQSLPALANKKPLLWYVWMVMSRLIHGMPGDRADAASAIISFCHDCGLGSADERERPILEEIVLFLVTFGLYFGIHDKFGGISQTGVPYVLNELCCRPDGAGVVIRGGFNNFLSDRKPELPMISWPFVQYRIASNFIRVLLTDDETNTRRQDPQTDPFQVCFRDEWKAAGFCVYLMEQSSPGIVADEASHLLFRNIPIMSLVHLIYSEPRTVMPALVLLSCIAKHTGLDDIRHKVAVRNLLLWASEETFVIQDMTISRLTLEALSNIDRDFVQQ